MHHRGWRFVLLAVVAGYGLGLGSACAITRYVVVSNPMAATPYTNWTTAATSISMAVSAALADDEILVGPGVYRLSNLINVNQRVLIRSVAGSEATVLDGQNLVPCVSLSSRGATLDGFTVTRGYNPENYGSGIILAADTRARNCTVVSNLGYGGGGIYMMGSGTVERCVIRGNQAQFGGGVLCYYAPGVVMDCLIENNSATNYNGGGISFYGNGAAYRCMVRNNTAALYGGGCEFYQGGKAENLLMYGNSAAEYGGGAIMNGGLMVNCTVISNRTLPGKGSVGGGIYATGSGATCRNVIVYFNSVPPGVIDTNHYGIGLNNVFDHCLTTPLPISGTNYNGVPQFRDPARGDFRLAVGSPGIDQGSSAGAPWNDLDGASRPMDGNLDRVAAWDIGAYEYSLILRTLALRQTGTVARLQWDCLNGRSYALQVSANPMSGAWSNVLTVPYTQPTGLHTQDVTSGVPRAFFRVAAPIIIK